jgi:predicted Zn-dependent protease
VTIERAAVEAALDRLGRGARLDVSAERVGLLRFAESRVVFQHDEERLRVRARVTRDGRTASGMLETLEPAFVGALADRLEDGLASLPKRDLAPATAQLGGVASRPVASEATLRAGAPDRYRAFEEIRAGLGDGFALGGSIRHDIAERVVSDSDGLYRNEVLTKATLQAIADRDGRTASVRRVHRDSAAIRVDDVASVLREELRELPIAESVSGPFRAVLRPQAALTLIATYGYWSLGAAGFDERRTAVAGKLDERVAGQLVTLVDDGNDPDGLPSGFDPEGTPKQRVPLLERGVVAGVVSNVAWSHVTGGVSTGHGVPDGWRFGGDPAPSHLLLGAGDASEEQLVEACGDGLVISRLDYLRVLHPKETLVTGTTRDATYRIENGRIVAWYPRVRLTFRIDEVLAAIVGVGAERERGDIVFMESVVVPPLLVEAGPLTL